MKKWEQDFEQDRCMRQKNNIRMQIYSSSMFKPINDSVTTYTYSNSYKKDTTTIKIVRVNGEWLC